MGYKKSSTKKYRITFLKGIFLIPPYPVHWRTRNPIEVTSPGKNRKKMVKADPQVWPCSKRALALWMVDPLFQIRKRIPDTISFTCWMQVLVLLEEVSAAISAILILNFMSFGVLVLKTIITLLLFLHWTRLRFNLFLSLLVS